MANDKMIRVEKGNVVLHVYEEEARHYLQLGYNITDEFGNIIQEAVPRDIGTLQHFWVEGKKKIAALEARVNDLESANQLDVVEKIKAEKAKAEEEVKTPAKRGRKKAE